MGLTLSVSEPRGRSLCQSCLVGIRLSVPSIAYPDSPALPIGPGTPSWRARLSVTVSRGHGWPPAWNERACSTSEVFACLVICSKTTWGTSSRTKTSSRNAGSCRHTWVPSFLAGNDTSWPNDSGSPESGATQFCTQSQLISNPEAQIANTSLSLFPLIRPVCPKASSPDGGHKMESSRPPPQRQTEAPI